MTTSTEKQKLLQEIDNTNTEDVEAAESSQTLNKQASQTAQSVSPTSKINMKYVSLFMLVGQNASLVLLTRYAKTRTGEQFVSTTAVVIGWGFFERV